MHFPINFSFLFFAGLALSLATTSCERAKPLVAKVREALERDAEPKQVAGLPESEKSGEKPAPPEPVKMEPVINKKARVSVLGYHDFTESRRPTQMIIKIGDFRAQMQAIKDAGIAVISMQQFLDWRREKANIPAESVMITIDDGWRDTHTLALPVLREFGYPFTVYLYTNYVAIGGRSMTIEQIQDLIAAGGVVCSHSISHKNMAKPPGRTSEAKHDWLIAELRESHLFLEERFGSGVLKTFAFPFGYYNDEVIELAREFGYEACFTVSPGKVTWETDLMKVNRYIIHGNSSANFDAALNFGGGGSSVSGRMLMSEQRDTGTGEVRGPLVTVFPPNGSTLKNRLPRIEVNVSALQDVQPSSIAMRITGLGMVPHGYDPKAKIISYQVPQRLRLDTCGVQVSFRHSGKRNKETIGWNFHVDRKAEYLDSGTTFIRPSGEPPDLTKELAEPEEKEEEETAEKHSKEAEGDSKLARETTAADLIDPRVSSH